MSNTSAMSEQTASGLVVSEKDWLHNQAEVVITKLNSAAKDMLSAGAVLIEVKEAIDHGQWETWVQEEVHISIRAAQNFMSGARLMIGLLGPDWEEHDILASHTALYALAGKNVPEEAQAKALKVMQQKQYLTEGMVRGIIEGAKRAAETEQLLEFASPEVADLVRVYDADPDIIPTLTILQDEEPGTFQDIQRSGTITCGDEEVPLHDANRRDIEDSHSNVRFETRMQNIGIDTDRVISGVMDAVTMTALDAPHELAHAEGPGLAAIVFSENDSLAAITMSLKLSDSKPLVIIAAVRGAKYPISANGKVPVWLNEIMENIANA